MNGSLCYSASSLFGKSVVDHLISGIVGDFVNSNTNHSVYLLTGFFVPKKRVNNKINKITLLFPLFKCLPWFTSLHAWPVILLGEFFNQDIFVTAL